MAENQRIESNPQVDANFQQQEQVNSVSSGEQQANLSESKTTADKIADQRDDVDEENTDLPSEVTDQLMDGSAQVFLAAFQNSQSDGLSREAAMQVAWSSVKQGFERHEDGSWHRKGAPDDRTIGSGVGGSAS